MSVDQMRYVILNAYSGVSWKNRVSRMSDSQVMAIYFRMLEGGKLEKKNDSESYKQFSLFDKNYISSYAEEAM